MWNVQHFSIGNDANQKHRNTAECMEILDQAFGPILKTNDHHRYLHPNQCIRDALYALCEACSWASAPWELMPRGEWGEAACRANRDAWPNWQACIALAKAAEALRINNLRSL